MISKTRQRLKYVTVDWITANISVFLFDVVRFYTLPSENIGVSTLHSFLSSPVLVAEQIIIPFLMLCIYAMSGFYNRPFHKSRIQEFFSTTFSGAINTLLIYFATLTSQETSVRELNYLVLALMYGAMVICTYTGRWMVTYHTARAFRSKRKLYNVMVAGSPEDAAATAARIRATAPRSGMHFAGYIALAGESAPFPQDAPVYTVLQLTGNECKTGLQEIFLASSGLSETAILGHIGELLPLKVPIKIPPESVSTLNSNIRFQSIYEEPYIDASTANVSEYTKNMKRLMDVCISSVALALLALPMAVIALIVKRTSKGPVIFKQERIGYRQKPFTIYKFRTMRTDAEATGPQLSSENDPRVTPLGKFLRKYRLDELPQFWNVLRGDMSLVGPRPERAHFMDLILARDPSFVLVHQVRPGITSWGVVKNGYASDLDQMLKRLRYDLVYISSMSIAVDIKILIYTAKTVLLGRGI